MLCNAFTKNLSIINVALIPLLIILLIAVLLLNTVQAFKIVTVGDISCNQVSLETMDKIINYLQNNKVDRFVFLGDIDYGVPDRGDDYFKCGESFLAQVEKYTELRIVKGNHEYKNIWGNMSKFGAQDFWSDKFDNVLLVGINTELSWKDNYSLVKNLLSKDAKYKYVFMHKPGLPETCKSLNADTRTQCGFYEKYNPMFKKQDVDCVIQAHIHTMAIFQKGKICYPIYGMGGAEPSNHTSKYSGKIMESDLNGFVVIEKDKHIFYANNGMKIIH